MQQLQYKSENQQVEEYDWCLAKLQHCNAYKLFNRQAADHNLCVLYLIGWNHGSNKKTGALEGNSQNNYKETALQQLVNA
jgi:hypothetical protein